MDIALRNRILVNLAKCKVFTSPLTCNRKKFEWTCSVCRLRYDLNHRFSESNGI